MNELTRTLLHLLEAALTGVAIYAAIAWSSAGRPTYEALLAGIFAELIALHVHFLRRP